MILSKEAIVHEMSMPAPFIVDIQHYIPDMNLMISVASNKAVQWRADGIYVEQRACSAATSLELPSTTSAFLDSLGFRKRSRGRAQFR